eukprot:scaffold65709_cov74-Phaeocystis_antarctica.AAC.5
MGAIGQVLLAEQGRHHRALLQCILLRHDLRQSSRPLLRVELVANVAARHAVGATERLERGGEGEVGHTLSLLGGCNSVGFREEKKGRPRQHGTPSGFSTHRPRS